MATVDYELPCGRMLDVNQIGHALGKAPKTIRNWIASGRLRSFKIGGHVRVSEDEVLELLARSHRWGK